MLPRYTSTYNPATGRYDITVNGMLIGSADSHVGCEQVAANYFEEDDERWCHPDDRSDEDIADMQQQAAYAAEAWAGEAEYYALRDLLAYAVRCAQGMAEVQR